MGWNYISARTLSTPASSFVFHQVFLLEIRRKLIIMIQQTPLVVLPSDSDSLTPIKRESWSSLLLSELSGSFILTSCNYHLFRAFAANCQIPGFKWENCSIKQLNSTNPEPPHDHPPPRLFYKTENPPWDPLMKYRILLLLVYLYY